MKVLCKVSFLLEGLTLLDLQREEDTSLDPPVLLCYFLASTGQLNISQDPWSSVTVQRVVHRGAPLTTWHGLSTSQVTSYLQRTRISSLDKQFFWLEIRYNSTVPIAESYAIGL